MFESSAEAHTAVLADRGWLGKLVEQSPTVMMVKDLDGRYVYVNRSWARLAGVAVDDAIGHTDAEIFPAANAESYVSNDRAVLERGDCVQFTESAPDGTKTVVRKFPLRDDTGQIVAIAGNVFLS